MHVLCTQVSILKTNTGILWTTANWGYSVTKTHGVARCIGAWPLRGEVRFGVELRKAFRKAMTRPMKWSKTCSISKITKQAFHPKPGLE